jgi:Zn-dependent protease
VEPAILEKIIIWVLSFLPFLLGITIHELAHGWVASKLGDRTAIIMGRLTLNPLKHIDPIGTILVPGILFFCDSDVYGWAKPIPVRYENFNHPKRDMVIVAAAGPIANLIMAIMWAFIAKSTIILGQNNLFWELIGSMGEIGFVINLDLMIFNLLPIPPLDGSKIVSGFLSDRMALEYNRLESCGFFIWPILYSTGVLRFVSNSIGRLVDGISSLVIPRIGGIINGTCTLFKGKTHVIQKRQMRNISPLILKEPSSQPPFLSSSILRSSTQGRVNSVWGKLGLSFWSRQQTNLQPQISFVKNSDIIEYINITSYLI